MVSFLFLALPEKGYSQPQIGCCQFETQCGDTLAVTCITNFGTFFPDDTCNQTTNMCQGEVTDVPTISEWGLIAMAGILGIVGFMVIRRKQATA